MVQCEEDLVMNQLNQWILKYYFSWQAQAQAQAQQAAAEAHHLDAAAQQLQVKAQAVIYPTANITDSVRSSDQFCQNNAA